MSRVLFSLSVVGMLALAGCKTGKHIKVESWAPAEVRLGERDMLVLTEGEGRQSAHAYVIQVLDNSARANGYYTIIDRSLDGVGLEINGRQARAINESKRMPKRGLYLRADVVQWDSQRTHEIVTEQEWVGHRRHRRYVEVEHERMILRATVVIEFTLVDSEGRVMMRRRDYEGEASQRADRVRKKEVLQKAASVAVHDFLDDITPHVRSTLVRVDEQDQAQRGFIQAARDGRTKKARKGLQAYLKRNPRNAAAHYNYAIMLDAGGRYQEALSHYETAIRLGGPRWYERGRAACSRRLREWNDF